MYTLFRFTAAMIPTWLVRTTTTTTTTITTTAGRLSAFFVPNHHRERTYSIQSIPPFFYNLFTHMHMLQNKRAVSFVAVHSLASKDVETCTQIIFGSFQAPSEV